ncbi:efflux RND transporter permease subunit [Entomohabitans teleogrylli]|uniref:efflux RND transporter permease subunit n=1 Tax=Entomohabitans teleogrylli TaxID=1384589 RepID=UPI00073D2193|nr:efflux RND transporter permease subunit [Entomohabitans teleogrylli]
MNISSWSIRNAVPVILLFMLLTVAGLVAFHGMKIQNMPDVELPIVTVTTAFQGAAAQQMENDIVRKLENALASLQDVRHITADIQDGSASVVIEFRIEKSLQEAVDDVRDAVSRVRADLPGGMDDPVVARFDLAAVPVLAYTVQADGMDEQALSWFIDNTVTKTLLGVKGVGAVNRTGGVTRQIRVALSPERLLALQVSAADISRQLQLTQQEASAGRMDAGGPEQRMRVPGTVSTAGELAGMYIGLTDGRQVRLDQIATVSDTTAERRSAAFRNGEPVVAFEVVRTRGGSEVDIMQAVRSRLTSLQQQHPGMAITEVFNFVDPVVENYEGSMQLLYEGALLAIIVVWLFLRNGRATLVAAVALPLSVIPAFAVMYAMGFTLNMVTLLALSLVVGVLVDDAIVEIENIMRHLAMGKTSVVAAREAADEIGLAVIATTFTLIAVFLPTAFMPGIVGRFFVQFGWTAAIAVFFSLVVARMLTPVMAAYLLNPLEKTSPQARWERGFSLAAVRCMKHRTLTLAVTVLLFSGILVGLGPGLSTGFMPSDDRSQTQVHLTLPPGTTFGQTLRRVREAQALVSTHPHVRSVYTTLGGGNAGGHAGGALAAADPRQATLTLELSPRQQREGLSKQVIEAQLRERLDVLPGVRVSVALTGATEKYSLVLTGDDGQILNDYARRVMHEMRRLPGIGRVTSEADLVRPEVIIQPDFARATDMGVTTEGMADALRVATLGDYGHALAKLNLEQRQIPIVVKLEDRARHSPALLSRLTVPGASGPVMLGNVADISMSGSADRISRYDRRRAVTIDVELNGLSLGEVEQQVSRLAILQQRSAGIDAGQTGDAELMGELMSGFTVTMGAGILCIFAVLVLLFRDFMQPVTILVALVLSVPGAVLSLYLARAPFSMPAILGLIMLAGVATKNAILLVEYAVRAQKIYGLSRKRALVEAGKKRTRPVVMTTVAMVGGMLPVAAGLGTDPGFRSPMAIVVIGGLITSTFLSLLVVPVIFTCVDDIRQWGIRICGRLRYKRQTSG